MSSGKRYSTLLLVLLSLVLAGACQPPTKVNSEEAQALQNQESKRKKAKTEKANGSSTLSKEEQGEVVALINDQSITLGEFEGRLNALAPFARARYNTPDRKKDFLDNMIQFELLAQEAKKQGFDKDPEVLLELKQAMVRKMMADQTTQTAQTEVPEGEVRAYYEEHKKDYVRPEKVRASQIVLADEAAIKKLHKELQKEFKKDPARKRRTFALKARDVSIDKPTANRAGDMRFFPHPKDGGTVDKIIADKSFALKEVGDLSEPFQTEKGWHIVMLTARKQRYERTFDDVKRNIANRLHRERRSLSEKQFIDNLKNKAGIVIHEEVLKQIKDPDPPAEPAGTGHGSHNHGHGEDKVQEVREKQKVDVHIDPAKPQNP